jgi:hypothetical protein
MWVSAAGENIDPRKRPFVIVDPRADDGPGIGGFKERASSASLGGPASRPT